MKAKQIAAETNKLLKTLPQDAEWEDLMYRIYVRQKVDKGLQDSAAGRVVTSAQIRKALKIAA
jgi:predicted transcriptional regulator